MSTVGDDLQVVKQDQLIKSDPDDYKRRRTIAIQRAHGGSCGFTVQVNRLAVWDISERMIWNDYQCCTVVCRGVS